MKQFLPRLILLMILATAGMTASAGSVMLSRCGGETASKASPTIEGKATVGVATLFTSDELTPLAGNEITTLRVGIVSKREFGIRNTIKKLNRQLEKAVDSFGNITDI